MLYDIHIYYMRFTLTFVHANNLKAVEIVPFGQETTVPCFDFLTTVSRKVQTIF